MESTLAMQAVAPRVKELQAKYANDPETLQLETARMYKTAGINPLAGCLPTLATIPVFIGLYRCGAAAKVLLVELLLTTIAHHCCPPLLLLRMESIHLQHIDLPAGLATARNSLYHSSRK
jgi:YidC/Oxa1 family membrane protein insertase